MKTKDIAAKYNINRDDFENFLITHNLPHGESMFSLTIDDENVVKYLKLYAVYKRQEQQKARQEAEEAERIRRQEAEEAERKRRAMAEMLISSGFNFEGYRIVKYSGYISGDDATQIPRSGVFGGDNGSNLTDALVRIRRQALIELKEAAYNLGCNAVIGVDFDYITLEPETANLGGGTLYEPYIICVTANGNAVIIEKDESSELTD